MRRRQEIRERKAAPAREADRERERGSVTTPPEIISYYHLNHSFWSLSDNKEVSR
jgi:hypothetical protein